ncbi:Uu.00g081740.m01.CDS01 [Anthostomella pinea]|uniref:Uu.00g081740.m01.CDS01 n=1 Tax=Anthostomella pinea TaxID=933095 RepID=A0AAI8VLB6_9PEZI|nr:Uu.00g081740.m01.CDS01 [Anthostomella pinea]
MANGLAIGTSVALSGSSSFTAAAPSGAVFVANGETFEASELGPGDYQLVGTNFSTTLTAGQAITFTNGDVISVGSSAFVVDGQTISVFAETFVPGGTSKATSTSAPISSTTTASGASASTAAASITTSQSSARRGSEATRMQWAACIGMLIALSL